jgi:hypothetical protein
MKRRFFSQSLRTIIRPVRRRSAHEHNPLLINSLAEFNFRPPVLLVFPGEQPDNYRRSRPQISTW